MVTELADDPLLPAVLPPAVPALRRKLELARLVAAARRRRARASPPAPPPSTSPTASPSSSTRCRARAFRPAAFAGVDAGRARRALAAQPALSRRSSPATRRRRRRPTARAGCAPPPRRSADAWAAVAARAPGASSPAPPARAAPPAPSWPPSPGCRRARSCSPASTPTCPPAVWDRLGADDPGAADHPQHGFRALADALGFDPARRPRPGIPRPPPAPERNALVSLALRPAPVTDQWRTEGATLAGRLAPALRHPRLGRGPRPARRGAGHRARASARPPRPAPAPPSSPPTAALARRVTAELDRWALIPDDSAGRPLALTPPGVLLRRLAALPGARLTPRGPARPPQAPARQQRPRRPRRPPPPHPPPRARPAPRRRALDRLARPRPLGRRPRRRRPRLDRLAPRRPRPPRSPARPPPSTSTSPATAPPPRPWPPAPTATRRTPSGRRRPAAQARALLDALAAEAEAAAPLAPDEYRALLASQMAARDVPEPAVSHPPRHRHLGHPRSPRPVGRPRHPRRPQRRHLAAAARRRPLARPRPPPRHRPAEPGAPHRPLGARLPAGDGRPRGAPDPRHPRRRGADRALALAPAPGKPALSASAPKAGPPSPPPGPAASASPRTPPASTSPPPASPPPGAPPRGRRPRPAPPSSPSPRSSSWSATPTASTPATSSASAASTRPASKPDALVRGKVIHAALDAFVTATEAGLPEDAAGSSSTAWSTALDRSAPWPAVRAIWTTRLHRASRWFLASEADRRARGAPAAREVEGRRDVHGLARPFALTARADRIDRLPGGYALYDYKSGSRARRLPKPAPSTSSSPSKRPSPRPAASRPAPPARRSTSSC